MDGREDPTGAGKADGIGVRVRKAGSGAGVGAVCWVTTGRHAVLPWAHSCFVFVGVFRYVCVLFR